MGILAVGLLLLDSFGLDFGRIADPKFATKFCQQALEPARISGSLHAYLQADSSLLQLSIEPLCFTIAVVQLPFTALTCLLLKNAIC